MIIAILLKMITLLLDTLLEREVRACFASFLLFVFSLMTNKFLLDAAYEEGGDPFVSGDLEINNEVYNNPAVMVSISVIKLVSGYFERPSTL